MQAAMVDGVRRFNRVVTQRVGTLDERFLARPRPLAASRVLWEIGRQGGEVRSLRAHLALDSGHLSRLLRALEAEGLIEVVPSVADGRVRTARLTPAGRRERDLLDRRSDELAESLLAPLRPRQRDRLVEAMATVERLLTASLVEIRTVDAAHPDARACVGHYLAELDRRSETPYDPTQGVTAEPHEMRPPAGEFLVAYLRDEPVGCGGVKHRPGAPSEIKRMWVAEEARGVGLGRRLLGELEERAVRGGARAARLETNRRLVEAIAMYRSAGYVEVAPFNDEPFADHWFEKDLRERV